jgi:hypothetical protein
MKAAEEQSLQTERHLNAKLSFKESTGVELRGKLFTERKTIHT